MLNSLQENEAEDVTNRLDGLKRAEKDRAKKIKDLENQLRKMQDELDNPPKLEDLEAINNEIVCCNFWYVPVDDPKAGHKLASIEHGA